ncbi:MAG TPA: 2-oxoacid:acceptor oxidoreductase family protein [Verrucomicrobiae bacterium]|nr:2-oxoacid:acceptor oxidoreductase family protein [Verrucomicrobiae bacterium]
MAKRQVLLTGTGGQGLILAAIMLAEAAVNAGENVVQSQSYGPEARGGASKAEVIISDAAINFPKVQKPEVVLAMSEAAYKKYGLNLPEDAVLIIDNTYVREYKTRNTNFYALPITKLTRSQFGSEQSSNVVALGAVAAISGMLPFEIVREAVLARAPKGTGERNLKALELGWQLGIDAQAPVSCGNAG